MPKVRWAIKRYRPTHRYIAHIRDVFYAPPGIPIYYYRFGSKGRLLIALLYHTRARRTHDHIITKQVITLILHKAASPPQTDGRIRQVAPMCNPIQYTQSASARIWTSIYIVSFSTQTASRSIQPFCRAQSFVYVVTNRHL